MQKVNVGAFFTKLVKMRQELEAKGEDTNTKAWGAVDIAMDSYPKESLDMVEECPTVLAMNMLASLEDHYKEIVEDAENAKDDAVDALKEIEDLADELDELRGKIHDVARGAQ